MHHILSGQSPDLYPPFGSPGFFFNTPEHLAQQGPGTLHTVAALNQRTGQTEARCAYFIHAGQALSPAAAPFGSVEFVADLPDTILDALIDRLLHDAKRAGATRIRLTNYPHCYAPEQAAQLTRQLLRAGFGVAESNQTYFLSVGTAPFAGGMHPSEQRRLRQCSRAGFRFEHWPRPDGPELARFIAETRHRQGYRLTIPNNRLLALLDTFPRQFPVFTVRDGNRLIALTVAVRVRTDILYSFLPASDPDYHTRSPMVMLTDGLFQYCRQAQIRLLDLGLSLDGDRRPKPGLLRFKQNLGALPSPKLVFERDI